MEMNYITLEDNKEYMILSTVEVTNNRYFILCTEENVNDICIRKVEKNQNNEDVLVKLESKEEFYKVLTLFNKLNRKGSHE